MIRRRRLAAFLACFAVMLAACSSPELEQAAAPVFGPVVLDAAPVTSRTPRGMARVGYPGEPAAWGPWLPGDVAATDLAALWGLPLLRLDAVGQLVPALAGKVRVVSVADEPTLVELSLRPGSWSDGTPVSAKDVVATIDALRVLPSQAARWAGVVEVTAIDPATVRVRFDDVEPRWAWLLAELQTVMPAEVARAGLELVVGPPTITGGAFTIGELTPGLTVRFDAHLDGPLGPPGLEAIELVVVPTYETALGLLDRDDLDVVTGHLALNPVDRAEDLDGVAAGAPVGGTRFTLAWRPDGRLGADAATRVRIGDVVALDEFVDGLLRVQGRVASSLVPGGVGPWVPSGISANALRGVGEFTLAVPRGQEAPGFAARTLQRAIDGSGGSVQLVFLDPELVVRDTQRDAALRVERLTPWPSARAIAGARPEAVDAAVMHERSGGPGSTDLLDAEASLRDLGVDLPLFEIGAVTAWSEQRIGGVDPSGWLGGSLADAATWEMVAGGGTST